MRMETRAERILALSHHLWKTVIPIALDEDEGDKSATYSKSEQNSIIGFLCHVAEAFFPLRLLAQTRAVNTCGPARVIKIGAAVGATNIALIVLRSLVLDYCGKPSLWHALITTAQVGDITLGRALCARIIAYRRWFRYKKSYTFGEISKDVIPFASIFTRVLFEAAMHGYRAYVLEFLHQMHSMRIECQQRNPPSGMLEYAFNDHPIPPNDKSMIDIIFARIKKHAQENNWGDIVAALDLQFESFYDSGTEWSNASSAYILDTICPIASKKKPVPVRYFCGLGLGHDMDMNVDPTRCRNIIMHLASQHLAVPPPETRFQWRMQKRQKAEDDDNDNATEPAAQKRKTDEK